MAKSAIEMLADIMRTTNVDILAALAEGGNHERIQQILRRQSAQAEAIMSAGALGSKPRVVGESPVKGPEEPTEQQGDHGDENTGQA